MSMKEFVIYNVILPFLVGWFVADIVKGLLL